MVGLTSMNVSMSMSCESGYDDGDDRDSAIGFVGVGSRTAWAHVCGCLASHAGLPSSCAHCGNTP